MYESSANSPPASPMSDFYHLLVFFSIFDVLIFDVFDVQYFWCFEFRFSMFLFRFRHLFSPMFDVLSDFRLFFDFRFKGTPAPVD